MPNKVIQVVDSSLVQGDEEYNGTIISSISSIQNIALNFCADLPEDRLIMTDVITYLLNKIRINFCIKS